MLSSAIRKIKHILFEKNEYALFLHIQKTAGTSLVHMAANYYSKGNFVTHGDFVDCIPESLNLIPFVSGHFGYDYAKHLIRDRYSFTFLRDPSERILSLYYYYRTQNPDTYQMNRIAHKLTLTEFLRQGFIDPLVKSRIWNNQTWQIAHGYGHRDNRDINDFSSNELIELALEHINNFSYIGLVENFENDSAVLVNTLGWPPLKNNIKVNENRSRRTVDDLSDEEQSLLNELTKLDYRLYTFVTEEIRKDLKRIVVS